jgi:non-ribosomal peptide synthetase component F
MDLSALEKILDWNREDVAVSYKPPLTGETVAATFDMFAKRQPSRCAVVTELNHELSYATVFDKSTAIARAIARSTPHTAISSNVDRSSSPSSIHCTLVALPRSTALPIALLGVVKSGHAYWAVDLTLQSPAVVVRNRERLDCRCVVADATAFGVLFPHGVPLGVLGIILNPSTGDVERTVVGSVALIPVEDHLRIYCPHGTMYLEFTSGSTGQPKAVAVPHSCGISLCRNSAAIFKWNASTRSVLYHTVAFDVHVYDLWGPWMHGGCVVALEGSVTDVKMVLDRTRASAATHLSMTPFGFIMMSKIHFASPSQEVVSTSLAALSTVMLCGEALDFTSLSPWFDHHAATGKPIPTFFNSYGITETTVINTFLEVTPERVRWPSSIGRRLPHTFLLNLCGSDDAAGPLRPAVHGEMGELYLAGDCVASGYITSTEKNDECFLPVPASIRPVLQSLAPGMATTVMYKSGDLASYSEDFGGFLYRGRADAEIKSAGFRVHPLEVEEHMNKLASLKEAVVVPATHGDGRKVLFGFVRKRSAAVTMADVLTDLRKRVADYKVPTMHFLEEHEVLPLSGTNKVERGLLSAWASGVLALPHDAPRPPLPTTK